MTMSPKKISIIVPCRNAGRYIKRCIASLVSQTMPVGELELIFVDDASTDGGETVGILQAFEQLYPDSMMVICLQENLRQGGARNVGIQYATGEYLLFVDADDWIATDTCAVLYETAVRHQADIVQFGHYICMEADGQTVCPECVHYEAEVMELREDADQLFQVLFHRDCRAGFLGKLFRRDMVMEAGVRFAEHVVYEEPLFVYPLFYFCRTFVFCDREFYFYRRNEEGTMLHLMEQRQRLWDHPLVQQQVFDFMKATEYYQRYYQLIDLYYLHGMMVETISFAVRRNFVLTRDEYEALRKQVLENLDLQKDHPVITKDPFYGKLWEALQKEAATSEEVEELMQQIENRRITSGEL